MSAKPSKAAPQKTAARKAPAPSGPAVASHRDEMVATTLARDAFSRERFEFLLRTILILFGILALSLAANVYYGLRETKVRYFAVDPEGGIREVMALDRPIQSLTEVLNWSTDAIVRSLTLNFSNWQQQLDEYRLSFTDLGWQSFRDALKRSKVLDTIIAQQLVTYVVPSGAPVVSRQGVGERGRYSWVIEIPIIITSESASSRSSSTFTVQATVVRRPEAENPRGLGIEQIVVR